MSKLKNIFQSRPSNSQPSRGSSILQGIVDAGLIGVGQKPHFVDELNDKAKQAYLTKIDEEKIKRGIEETQRENTIEDNKIALETSENERKKIASKNFADSILAQYPELKAEDVEGKDLLSLAQLIETQKTRREYGRREDDNIQNRQDERMQEKLSKRMQDSGLKTLSDSLDQIDTLMQGKKDIPGYGQTGMAPNIFLSRDGKKARNLVQGLSNVQLKARSGAAVTDQEMKRFLTEFGSGRTSNDEALQIGLQRLRDAIQRDQDSMYRGFSPKVLDSYESSEGYPAKPEGFTVRKDEKKSLTTDQQKRLAELEAKAKAGK